MRLLLITNVFPNPTQPTRGTFNLEMTRALQRLGHEIEVVSPVSWVDEWRGRRRGRRFDASRRAVWEGTPVSYPRYYYTPRVLRLCYGWFLWYSIRGMLLPLGERFQPDAVLAYWAHPDGYVGVRLARHLGVPCVAIVGGSDVLILCRQFARRRCIMNVFDAVGLVVPVSEDLKRGIERLGVDPGKVHVCWRGVDPEKFHPGDRREARRRLGLPPGRPLLLWLGNMVPVKGLETLIDAAAILKQRGIDFGLLLVGSGRLEAKLRRRCAARGLEEHVRFVGRVMHDALPDWYRAANLTVLPSWSEGIPNVLLESMASRVPFVASRVGGIPEIATEGIDLLVPPGDVTALADAIATQLSAGDRNGEHPRKLFTWTDAAHEMTRLMHLLKAPAGQADGAGTPIAADGHR